MWACYKGRTEVVELLLSHGANPSVTGLVSVNKKFICDVSGKFFQEILQAGCTLDFIVNNNDLDLIKDKNLECEFKTMQIFFSTYFSIFMSKKAMLRACVLIIAIQHFKRKF